MKEKEREIYNDLQKVKIKSYKKNIKQTEILLFNISY